MARTLEMIKASEGSAQSAQTSSAYTQLLPGYLVGYRLIVVNGTRLDVGPGSANVWGNIVRKTDTTSVEEIDWNVTRTPGNMYYLYLSRSGHYYVDKTAPKYLGYVDGDYHPELQHRYLGKFYVSAANRIVFALSQQYSNPDIVTVGANGYTGYANDYCDGVDDQVQINDALTFLSEAYGGGTAQLVGRTFYLTAAIEMKSGVTLALNGVTIEKNCNDYAIEAVGTSATHLTNVGIVGPGTITRDAADTNNNSAVYVDYVDAFTLKDVTFDSLYYKAVNINNSTGPEVRNCKFDSCLNWCIAVLDSSHAQITGNEIFGTAHNVSTDICGIYIHASSGSIVTGNTIHDIITDLQYQGIYLDESDSCIVVGNVIRNVIESVLGGVASRGRVLLLHGDGHIISGNHIENTCTMRRNTAGFNGCFYADDDNNQISGNYHKDNGNGISYANCETTDYPCVANEAAYSVVNATPTRVNAPAPIPYGAYCMKINKDSAAAAGNARYCFHDHIITVTTDMAGLPPGLSYTFTCKFHCPAAVAVANALVRFSYYDSGAWVNADYNPAANGVWEDVSLTLAVPATATGMRLYVQIDTAEAQNDAVYIDHCWLRPDGMHNEVLQNYYSIGSGNRLVDNSWQRPFQS